jgi:HEAT repeat protein
VAELRARLADPDESVRVNAALDLADAGSADGAEVLVEALGHNWGVVRRSFALPSLVRIGGPAVPALERAAVGDGARALGAALSLAEIDAERFPPHESLRRALAGADRDAADDALQFLWPRPDLSAALSEALLALVSGSAEADDATEWPGEPRVTAALLLARDSGLPREVHEAVVELLGRPEAVLRWAGALALGKAGASSVEAVAALAALAADEGETPEVRVAAAYAHGRLADAQRSTLPLLERLLSSETAWIRVVAVRIAGELGAGRPLHRASEDTWSCHFSAHPLAALARPESAVPLAVRALDDPDANVRRSAILALSWLGAEAAGACERLAGLLPLPYFGPLAAETLARIGEASRPWLERAGGEAAAYGVELLDGVEPTSFRPPVSDFYVPVRVEWTAEKLAACEALFERTVAAGGGNVEYDLPYPKHEFLAYLSDVRRLMLHGSKEGDLEVLRPLRSSTDSSAAGNVSGIYAEPDAIRPIYFAVIDRTHSFGLMNTCFAVGDDGVTDERLDDPSLRRYYRLSIGALGLTRPPWRRGTVYALPRDTFEFWEEWTSRVPVRPLLRLTVDGDDLPLRNDLWGSDLRKPDSIWVDPTAPYPYLEDVWALPLKSALP